MARRLLSLITILVLVTLVVFAVLSKLSLGDDSIQIFVSAAMGGVALLIKKYIEEVIAEKKAIKESADETAVTAEINEENEDEKPEHPIVVYVFGSKGSGKTTLLQHTIYAGEVPEPDPSKGFRTYQSTVSCGETKQVDIRIRDHAGEKPGESVKNILKEDYIDGLVLVVDLAPAYEISEEKTDHFLIKKYSREEVAQRIREDPLRRLKERRDEQERYIGEAVLHILLSFMVDKHLRRIILVINKVDLLNGVKYDNGRDLKDTVEELYSRLIRSLERAVTNTPIELKIHVVSAIEDNLRQLRRDIVCDWPDERFSQ